VAERAPLYADVARLTIDTDGVAPEAIVDAVLSGLELEAQDG
jgi:hypothetical protein